MTIDLLLVEADPGLRLALAEPLRRRGFTVREAVSGRDAAAAMRERPPDLMVLDGSLPDTTGIEWLGGLRAEGHRFPVIFLAGAGLDAETFRRLRLELDTALVARHPVAPVPFAEDVVAAWRERNPGQGPGPSPASFEECLADLRAEYLADLPGQLPALVAAVERARTEGEAAAAARASAHRLRGTAGTYGLTAVAEAAARLEESLELLSPGQPPGFRAPAERDAAWGRAVQAARDLEQAVRGPATG